MKTLGTPFNLPRTRLPSMTCNSHCHVLGPRSRFPFAAKMPFEPPDAPKEDLFALHDALGIDRTVIVQSVIHGYDHRAVAEAIAARPERTKGLALLHPEADAHTISELTSKGFSGARFHLVSHMRERIAFDRVMELALLLEEAGWYFDLHLDAGALAELGDRLKTLELKMVVDHMGYPDASLGVNQPGFVKLLSVMENPNIHVKVSGSERASRLGPPYDDAVPLATELVANFPDRVLWANDWPHLGIDPFPDQGMLIDLLEQVAPTPEARQALLVDNPARFFGF